MAIVLPGPALMVLFDQLSGKRQRGR